MNEYIDLLFYNKEIKSELIEKFLNFLSVEKDSKINLKKLRDYYLVMKETPEDFFNLIREITLRGGKFVIENENKLIPKKYVKELFPRIEVLKDKKKYLEIPWDVFNLSNIINDFKIESDLFFNNIPLEGFSLINENIDLEKFKNILENKGFLIIQDTVKKTEINNKRFIIDISSYENIERNLKYQKFEGNRLKMKDFLLLNLNEIYKEENGFINSTELIIKELEKMKGIGRSTAIKFIEEISVIKNMVKEISNTNDLERKEKFIVDINDYINIEKNLKSQEFEGNKLRMKNFLLLNLDNIYKEENGFINSTELIIKELEKIRGVGRSTIMKFIEEVSNVKNRIKEINKTDNLEIKEELLELSCDFLISKNIKFKEFNNKTIIEILDTIDIEEEKIKKVIAFNYNFFNINEILEKALDNEEEKILYYRYTEGLTLDETGKKYNVTRQRIGQKEIKAIKKIKNSTLQINNYLNIFLKENNYFEKDLKFYIKERFLFFIELMKVKKNVKGKEINLLDLELNYYENLGIFSYIKLDENKTMNELEDVININNDFLSVREIIFKNGIFLKNKEDLEVILISLGYKKHGNYYSRVPLRKNDVLNIIFKDLYINQSVVINENSFNEINNFSIKELNIDLSTKYNSVRAIEGSIERAKEIIQFKKKTYCHVNYLEEFILNIEIMDEINNYIQSKKNEWLKNKELKPYVNSEELEEKFKEELKGIDKETPYFLMKYYYEDEYSFGGNNWHIEFSANKKSREELVLELLEINKGIIDKKTILNSLCWPPNRLEDLISKSDNLILINKKIVKISYFEISEDLKKILENLISKELTFHKHISVYKILDQLRYNINAKTFLTKYNVTKEETLTNLIKCIFPKKYTALCRCKILVEKHNSSLMLEEIFCDSFSDLDTFSRDEMQTFFKDYGYKEASLSLLPKKLEENKIISRVDFDKYTLFNKINLSKEIIENSIKFFYKKIEEKKYLNLSKLSSEIKKIGRSGIHGVRKMNEYILKLILLNNTEEFKEVVRLYSDYRYDKIILAKKSSNINSLEDLIYQIIKYEYNGENYHEIFLYDYLSHEKGILSLVEDVSKKILPFEIKNNNSNQIIVNESGIVTLNAKESTVC